MMFFFFFDMIFMISYRSFSKTMCCIICLFKDIINMMCFIYIYIYILYQLLKNEKNLKHPTLINTMKVQKNI
jgi:hypothetical protein